MGFDSHQPGHVESEPTGEDRFLEVRVVNAGQRMVHLLFYAPSVPKSQIAFLLGIDEEEAAMILEAIVEQGVLRIEDDQVELTDLARQSLTPGLVREFNSREKT